MNPRVRGQLVLPSEILFQTNHQSHKTAKCILLLISGIGHCWDLEEILREFKELCRWSKISSVRVEIWSSCPCNGSQKMSNEEFASLVTEQHNSSSLENQHSPQSFSIHLNSWSSVHFLWQISFIKSTWKSPFP